MARLVVATALLLAAAAAVQAQESPPTCSNYTIIYDVDDGLIASGPNKTEAADAAEQLAAGIAEELHKNEDCEVTAWLVEKACRKPVTAGDVLEGNTTVEVNGTLYDMEIVEHITCPDGGFKVRYEARGVKPDEPQSAGTPDEGKGAQEPEGSGEGADESEGSEGKEGNASEEEAEGEDEAEAEDEPAPAPAFTLSNIETRFIDVFDSTYV